MMTLEEKVIKRLLEQSKKEDLDVEKAVDQLNDLDNAMKDLIKGSVKKEKSNKDDSGVKKTESLSMVAGLAIGLPGLLELLGKMAKLLAKGLNKITGSKNFDEKKEGKTFEHAAHSLHKKYISWLKPIAKLAFKKQVGKDEKKAELYAQVMYAVLLAAVATHAMAGAAQGAVHGFKEMGHIFHTAFEAAHSSHAGVETVSIVNAMKAALIALGETEAANEISVTLSA